MTISLNIELTELEQSVVNQRLQRLGLTMDQWAKQVITNRIENITSPHKMAKAQELLDKFHAAPDELRHKLMSIEAKPK